MKRHAASYPQSDDAECGYCDGLGHEHKKPCPECGGNDPYPSGGDAK